MVVDQCNAMTSDHPQSRFQDNLTADQEQLDGGDNDDMIIMIRSEVDWINEF